ncbi:hypothetical protein GCM10010176_079230 [Nonomuraea spiralis]|nr:hypothetical protein GCM10010176_079230 [Nonomuraea spiralis]
MITQAGPIGIDWTPEMRAQHRIHYDPQTVTPPSFRTSRDCMDRHFLVTPPEAGQSLS